MKITLNCGIVIWYFKKQFKFYLKNIICSYKIYYAKKSDNSWIKKYFNNKEQTFFRVFSIQIRWIK